MKSRRLYNTIARAENINFDYKQCGILKIYKNVTYFEEALKDIKFYNYYTVETQVLSASKCLELEPRLYHAKNSLVGGIWTPDDAVGDIHKFCTEIARILAEKYNTKFEYNYKVKKLQELAEYDRIVIANGSDACEFMIDNLCVYPVKGYSMTLS